MTALVTKHLPLVSGAPDGIKKLRALILELAVRGKLVSQQACDEPAETLVRRIHSEKTRLAVNGVIRRPSPLASIDADLVPYVLPARWVWARWDTVALKIGDIDHKMPETAAEGVPFVSPRDFYPGNVIDFDRAKRVSVEDFERLSAKIKAERGDLIYPRYGTIGENVLVNVDRDFLVSYSCAVIKVAHGFINPKYQFYFSLSDSARRQAKAAENKTTQANVGIRSIQEYLFPVPPLAEQHRIVAKVDELMALCDRLEADQADAEAAHAQLVQALLGSLTQAIDAADFRASWQRLSEHFHTLFTTEASIDALKQTVLQLAVVGKLVPQIKRDGCAKDLLASIASMGKSKGPVTPSVDADLPALPPSWCWIRIADLAHVGTGATPSRTNPAYFDPPEISWVTSGETSQTFVRSTGQKVSPLALEETNLTVYPVGTLIVAMYGQGKTRGQVTELLIEACTNQACAAIQLICDDTTHRRFVKYFFEKSYDELRSLAAGGAQPNLNLGKIKETLIPLPPLAEQHRIVAKVDELMALCDQLKAQLAEARQQHAQLATVLVEQAVA